MKNKKISIIRKKLDKLDLKMLSIIKKRSSLVNKILEQKQQVDCVSQTKVTTI